MIYVPHFSYYILTLDQINPNALTISGFLLLCFSLLSNIQFSFLNALCKTFVNFITYNILSWNCTKILIFSHDPSTKTFCFISKIVGGRSSGASGKGKSHQGSAKYGFSLVKGKANHPMEDYHVARFVQFQRHELGLFAIYDGHLGHSVPAYLQKHLFANILKEVGFLFSIVSFHPFLWRHAI